MIPDPSHLVRNIETEGQDFTLLMTYMKKKPHTYTKKECTVLVNTTHFKNARELLQNCLADVKAVTSELNVKGKLWKLTHLKISSVTSAPLGLSDRAVVCWPEKKKQWSNTSDGQLPFFVQSLQFARQRSDSCESSYSVHLAHFSSQHNEP